MQSIDRAIGLLRSVAHSGRAGQRLIDLAQSSGLSKSTAHRMLAALAASGLIEQDAETRRFRAGMELYLLGAAAAECFSIVDLARPLLMQLAEQTGDTAFLSVPLEHQSMCVDRQIGSFPIKALTVEVGDRRPLGVGSGSLALLAFRSDEEVEQSIAVNAKKLATYGRFDAPLLRELVAATRRRGYSFIDGQLIAGMSAVGVPIFNERGRAVAALSVAAISARLSTARRRMLVPIMQDMARRIERRLAPPGATVPAQRSVR